MSQFKLSVVRQRAMLVLALACAALDGASAAGAFDGTYQGAQKLTVTDNSAACGTAERNNITVQIVDNRFTTTWAGNPLDVVVAADGAFKASAVRAQTRGGNLLIIELSGRIVGGVFEANYGHSKCAVHMMLKKS